MKSIFVFGSNEAGRHGAGAALEAYKKHGARWGMGYGHYGDSFAIPTKDQNIETLPKETIRAYVKGFLAYAKGHPELTFKVTRIGCGLAGLKDEDMSFMFMWASSNLLFDEAWKQHMEDGIHKPKFWGTF
ncbi:hypothetical protein [Paraburkholderia sp. SIMBA_054]|uniref:A1S_2505 family phage non-structural protein n=1 Tax=Paraburkholderia sp. SIMBA_054 TaxID=3085795 RepID=UPI00397B41E1